MKSLRVTCAVLMALMFMLSGCSDDENPANPGGGGTVTLLFVGTVNGDNGGLSGSVTFNVSNTTVTGTFNVVTPAAASHALTGTYDTGTKALTATGGGYNFAGVYDGSNRCEGTMSGTSSGLFTAIKDDSNAAEAFCGEFTGSDDGVWNFTIDGTTVTGTYTTTSGTVGALDGTISGTTITIGTLATGTRTGDNVSGTWDAGGGNTGTWTGAKCN